MDLFEKRIKKLKKELDELRVMWKTAGYEKREDIKIRGMNKRTELSVLEKIVRRRN